MNRPFSFKKFVKSFGYALNGLGRALRSEQNMKVHALAAIAAVVLGFCCRISALEFAVVIMCIGVVTGFEILNTALEKLCDFVSPRYHEQIKVIKDLAAAAVLIVSVAALLIGIIIFLPKFF
ncbi:diacylglycerol kinase [Niabella insulamsoli]|uniref:diacylglycerol kinase n=1 Tax=Niabella insulamsoli TaxID=3144874 RepID=UPI0031FC5E4A